MTRDLTDQKGWVSSKAIRCTGTLYLISIEFSYFMIHL